MYKVYINAKYGYRWRTIGSYSSNNLTDAIRIAEQHSMYFEITGKTGVASVWDNNDCVYRITVNLED